MRPAPQREQHLEQHAGENPTPGKPVRKKLRGGRDRSFSNRHQGKRERDAEKRDKTGYGDKEIRAGGEGENERTRERKGGGGKERS
eukprot:7593903-Pyramimonas_sp.AAC.1